MWHSTPLFSHSSLKEPEVLLPLTLPVKTMTLVVSPLASFKKEKKQKENFINLREKIKQRTRSNKQQYQTNNKINQTTKLPKQQDQTNNMSIQRTRSSTRQDKIKKNVGCHKNKFHFHLATNKQTARQRTF